MTNTCIICKETWKVNPIHAKLDVIDQFNLTNHNQLYSICEDCSHDGECVSVMVDVKGKLIR
jgi:hypothetical protein